MKLAVKFSFRNRRGLTGIEMLIAVAGIMAVIFGIIIAIRPIDRYRDARNRQRLEECYSVVNAMLLKTFDENQNYLGEASVPIDNDPKTAQIIVSDLARVTCVPGLNTTPVCPGALKAGLSVVEGRGRHCIAQLDDGRNNVRGLVNQYLMSMPIDPAEGRDYLQDIPGAPLGPTNTGYYINRFGDGRLLVGACHAELGADVHTQR